MSIIIVSDVFGLTSELTQLAEEINTDLIVDPYSGKYMCFREEQEAYSNFISHVGFENYLLTLKKVVEKQEKPIVLIGFSAGASIVWRISNENLNDKVKLGVCFYGTQIRNFTEVEPKFPIQLVLPKYEEHFDVDSLADQLSHKKNTQLSKVPFLHGFMNKRSVNFNQSAYGQQVSRLKLL